MATTTTLGFSILSRYSGHGVTQARRDLAALRAQMSTLDADLNKHTKLLGGIPQRWKAIGVAAAAVAPALVPIGAAALQATGALTVMSVSVGAALGAYGAAMKGAIKQTMEMAKAGKALSPVQKEFVGAVDGMKKAWASFIKQTSGQTLSVATNVVKGLTSGIKLLKPLIDAVHPSLLRVSQDFDKWMKGDSAKRYSGIIAGIAKTSMPLLVKAGKDVLNVLGDGFRAFAPLANNVAAAIARGAAALRSWSDGGGFQRFLQYARENGPAVQAFFAAFRAALSNVFAILKEFAGGSLAILTDIFRTLASLDPGAVKAFASALLLLKSPLAWLVLNCPPLRNMIIAILGSLNSQTVYAMAGAFMAWRVAILLVNAGLISTPIGWVVLAVGALVTAIVMIATKTTWFQTAWTYTWNAIQTAATAVWAFLQMAWNSFTTAMINGWTAVSGALVAAWNAVWYGISLAATTIWMALTTAWNAVVYGLSVAWTTVSAALVAAWNFVWGAIALAAQTIWAGLQLAWNLFITGLQVIWTAVSGPLMAAWSFIWESIRISAQAVWGALQLAWQLFTTTLSVIWTSVSTALTAAWNFVWGAMSTAAQAIWTAMQFAWNAFITGLQVIWTAVSAALSAAWNAVWTAMSAIASAIWTAMQAAWNAFIVALQTIWSTVSAALSAAWTAVWNGVKLVAETIWTALRTAWQFFLTAVQTAWTVFSAPFVAAWNLMWNTIKTAAETVWNALKVAWQAFLTGIQAVWAAASEVLKAAWTAVWNFIRDTAQAIWETIKTAWTNFTTSITDLWNKAGEILKSAWTAVWNFLKDTAQDIWNQIGNVIEKAINGIIGIINKIIGAWNSIASAVNLDSLKLDTIGTVSFAVGGIVGDVPEFASGGTVDLTRGGAIRGFAPGRDEVPAMLSRGEGVLVPEAVRGLGGSKFVHAANSHFSNGRGGQRVSGGGIPAFASGGMLPANGSTGGINAYQRAQPGQGWGFFAPGGMVTGDRDPNDGPLPGLGGGLGTAPDRDNITGVKKDDDDGGGFLGFVKDIAESALGLNTIGGANAKAMLGFIGREAIEKAFDFATGLLDNFGEAGDFGKMMVAGTKRLVKGMIDELVRRDEEAKQEYMAQSVAGAQSVGAWSGLAAQALAMAGLSPSQLPAFLALMAAESGGNPNAMNGWDINAQNGVPSQGLMQVIPPTFAAYHVPGTSNNILDPLANMAASANYIKHRYGGNVPGSPYANGTPGATRGQHLVGEEGPEMVNFAGGETVTPAKETAGILGGGGSITDMAAQMGSAMPDMGGLMETALSGGSSEDIVAQIQAVIEAAKLMTAEVTKSWTGVTAAGTTAQAALTPVLQALIATHATQVPAAMATMSGANTTAWTTMTTTAQAQWVALQAGVFTPAKAEMTTAVPTALTTMSAANTAQWASIQTTTDTTWGGLRDGSYTEAGDYMAVKMPTWGQEMDVAVTAAWTDMAGATAAQWKSMEQGTGDPVNWIIENPYNNGIAAMWNAVAGVIWEGGGRELPTVNGFASGGRVSGPGTGTSDSIPAMLSKGEHVLTAREVQKAGGHQAIYRMRAGLMGEAPAGFAVGGAVDGELKRGNLWAPIEGTMRAAVADTKAKLTDLYGRTTGSADIVSPADWIEQYVKKDDELNKFVGGPPWIPGVSDAITSWGGVTVNQRTADMLNAAMALGFSGSASQGSFNVGVAASAGTHDGGGVVDLVPATAGNIGALRAVGFAAWGRGAEWGSPSFSSHIHAVALGDPTVSPGAAAQQQSFLAGGNGLADGGPDNFSGGLPAIAYKDVDPADIKQNVVSYDRGGFLKPGYTMAYNGTGKPEPVGHDLVPKGSGGVTIHMPITVNGSANAQDVVDGIRSEVLPELRRALNKGTGNK